MVYSSIVHNCENCLKKKKNPKSKRQLIVTALFRAAGPGKRKNFKLKGITMNGENNAKERADCSSIRKNVNGVVTNSAAERSCC